MDTIILENGEYLQFLEDLEDIEDAKKRLDEPEYSFDLLLNEFQAEGLI